MNYKRVLVAIPGLIVWFMTFPLDNGPTKYKLYGLMLALYGLGWLFYKYVLRTKEDEKLDREILSKNEASLQAGVNKIANIIPNAEVKAANALKALLSKADDKSPAEKIRELDLLKSEGIITEEEFRTAKAKIIGG